MKTYPKNIKRQLHQLAGIAYQREIESLLTNLEKQFTCWRSNEVDCWKLHDSIHQYHHKDARELYKQYEMTTDCSWNVASALRRDILKKEEISDNVLDALANLGKVST